MDSSKDIHHDCGHCMFHLPNFQIDGKYPTAIASGRGKGKPAYWLCKCKSTRHYMKGRVEGDGTRCSYFEDRYSDPRKIDEWIRNCHTTNEDEEEYYSKKQQQKSTTKGRPDRERKYLKRGLPAE